MQKKTVVKLRIVLAYNILTKFEFKGCDGDLIFILEHNRLQLEPIFRSVEKIHEPTKESKEYTDEYNRLTLNHARRDPKTKKPIMLDDTRMAIEDPLKFDEEHNKLKEKYKTVIKQQEKKEEDYTKHLKNEIEIEYIEIPWDLMPKDPPPTKPLMMAIYFMIDPDRKSVV